jgi:hypothetical protein
VQEELEDAAMTRPHRIILGAVLLILGGTHGALATISPSGIDARLRLDWEVGQTRDAGPEVQGYVINDYMRPAMSVGCSLRRSTAMTKPLTVPMASWSVLSRH